MVCHIVSVGKDRESFVAICFVCRVLWSKELVSLLRKTSPVSFFLCVAFRKWIGLYSHLEFDDFPMFLLGLLLVHSSNQTQKLALTYLPASQYHTEYVLCLWLLSS